MPSTPSYWNGRDDRLRRAPLSDIFDMFSPEPTSYSGSLWLWLSTQGVTLLGGDSKPTIETVEALLRQYTGVTDLVFIRDTLDGDQFANETFEESVDVAIVIRDSTGDVVSHARLPAEFNRRGPPIKPTA